MIVPNERGALVHRRRVAADGRVSPSSGPDMFTTTQTTSIGHRRPGALLRRVSVVTRVADNNSARAA